MEIHVSLFLSLAIGFTITFFIIPKIIKVSRLKNIFDIPNHRSAATSITPSLGGVAIFAGFIVSLVISSDSFNIDELKYLFAGTLVMFVVGLKDDLIGFAARKKLFIQLIVAIYLVTMGHYQITNLHGILGIEEISYAMGLFLSVIMIVGIINAINLIDGIDGLASGLGILISIVYGILFLKAGDFVYAITSFSLTGSLIAFFLYNVFGNTNKIFMGDTGSLVLGITVALLTIHFNELNVASGPFSLGVPAISFAIIIVPVIDTLRVFAIRIYRRKSPFTPDMNHLHHHLLKLTNSHLTSSLIIIGVNILIILLAFGLIDLLGNANLFIVLLFLGFALALIPCYFLKVYESGGEKEGQIKSLFTFLLFQKKRPE